MPSRRQQRSLVPLVIALILIALYLYRQYHSVARHGPPSSSFGCGVHCGTERWAVKTLSDPDSAGVNFSPRPVTVAWLTSQVAPQVLPEDSRIAPLEFQAFTVRARLLGIKEEDDRDFHILLADIADPTSTMIAEIPSDECSAACSSRYASSFEDARREVESQLGMPADRFTDTRGDVIVDVTGIAFFDFFHRQRGVAPNAIELHPVLSIRFEE
jgi:hypothetical protein